MRRIIIYICAMLCFSSCIFMMDVYAYIYIKDDVPPLLLNGLQKKSTTMILCNIIQYIFVAKLHMLIKQRTCK
jgi:hypothetical protein